MIPQVLVGLGLAGLASAALQAWLHRLQPLFLGIAVVSLVYAQAVMWSHWRQGRPVEKQAQVIVWSSTFVNVAVLCAWVWGWLP